MADAEAIKFARFALHLADELAALTGRTRRQVLLDAAALISAGDVVGEAERLLEGDDSDT